MAGEKVEVAGFHLFLLGVNTPDVAPRIFGERDTEVIAGWGYSSRAIPSAAIAASCDHDLVAAGVLVTVTLARLIGDPCQPVIAVACAEDGGIVILSLGSRRDLGDGYALDCDVAVEDLHRFSFAVRDVGGDEREVAVAREDSNRLSLGRHQVDDGGLG